MDFSGRPGRFIIILLFFALVVLAFWYESGRPAGRFYGIQHTVELNQNYGTGGYILNLSLEGVPSSVLLSGIVSGDGGVRIYLMEGSNETLVYSKNAVEVPEVNVLEEGSDLQASLAYAKGSLWDSNDNGWAVGNGVVDYSILAELREGLNKSHLCSEWMVYSNDTKVLTRTCLGSIPCCNRFEFTGVPGSIWNETFYVHIEKYGATRENMVGVQLHYVDVNLSTVNPRNDVFKSQVLALPAVFKNLTQKFEDACVDSCNITTNSTSITLRIVVGEEAELQLKDLKYYTM